MEKLAEYQQHLQSLSPEEILGWAVQEFGSDKVALASSFGAEDQILTQMAAKLTQRPRIFTLDTGRLFEATYATWEKSRLRYQVNFEVYHPEAVAVEKLVASKGPFSFKESVENRKECCFLRKVEPLGRALNGLSAWITGLRQEQSVTRSTLEFIEWDGAHQIYKINPLARWSESEVWEWIKNQKVTTNPLHQEGFPSIGCAPCTRAIAPGEDIRSGRWWWENPENKECGLHIQPR